MYINPFCIKLNKKSLTKSAHIVVISRYLLWAHCGLQYQLWAHCGSLKPKVTLTAVCNDHSLIPEVSEQFPVRYAPGLLPVLHPGCHPVCLAPTRFMFYKGHVIRDTSQIFRKIKGQRLVDSEKIRDNMSLICWKKAISRFAFLSVKARNVLVHGASIFFR